MIDLMKRAQQPGHHICLTADCLAMVGGLSAKLDPLPAHTQHQMHQGLGDAEPCQTQDSTFSFSGPSLGHG